jgi:2-hydroxy-3-oxopropionate reductase
MSMAALPRRFDVRDRSDKREAHMSNHIALIGAGAMGGAIGTRLLNTGNKLTVFDPDQEKMAALAGQGADVAGSAAEAAANADYVVCSLNSPATVRAAVFGQAGVAEGARPGTLIIDMSSIDPDATKALAAEAADRGLGWVDSPLSGGAPKALTGELTLMLGGRDADVARAQNVLKHLASNCTHMGGSGAGQTTKLINQVLCGLNFLAVAEATQLAMDAGVDAARIPQALKGGRADSAILQEYMPRFVAKDYRRTGRIDNMVKDLNGAQDLARRTNTPMPLTAVCAEVHRLLTAAGLGGEDQAALMEFFNGMKMNKEKTQ